MFLLKPNWFTGVILVTRDRSLFKSLWVCTDVWKHLNLYRPCKTHPVHFMCVYVVYSCPYLIEGTSEFIFQCWISRLMRQIHLQNFVSILNPWMSPSWTSVETLFTIFIIESHVGVPFIAVVSHTSMYVFDLWRPTSEPTCPNGIESWDKCK